MPSNSNSAGICRAFLPPLTLDRLFLAFQISLVLERGLDAREIDVPRRSQSMSSDQLAVRDQRLEA